MVDAPRAFEVNLLSQKQQDAVTRSLDLSDDARAAFSDSVSQARGAQLDLFHREGSGFNNPFGGETPFEAMGLTGDSRTTHVEDMFTQFGSDLGETGESAPDDSGVSQLQGLLHQRFSERADGGAEYEDYGSWDGSSSADDVADPQPHLPGKENSLDNQAHRTIAEHNGAQLLYGQDWRPEDLDPTDPRLSLAEARYSFREISDRYDAESSNSSLIPAAQIEYIDEQLRVIDEYKANSAEPIDPCMRQAIDENRAFLQHQRDVLLEKPSEPDSTSKHEVLAPDTKTPNEAVKEEKEPAKPDEVLPPPRTNPQDTTEARDVPRQLGEPTDVPEDDPASQAPAPKEKPDSADPSFDPGLIIRPNEVDDPQPTGKVSDIFTKGPGAGNPTTGRPPEYDFDAGMMGGGIEIIFTQGAGNPATTTPLPMGIDMDGMTPGDISATFAQGAGNPNTTTPLPPGVDEVNPSNNGPAVIDVDLGDRFGLR